MNEQQKKQLKEIYAKIPKINCKGLCTDFCGAIGMEVGEAEAMTVQAGFEPTISDDLVCGYLKEGRCSVYENRPAICRLFGVAEKLTCPHGCEFEKIISIETVFMILQLVRNVAGDGEHVAFNCSPEQFEEDKQKKRYNIPL